MFSYTENNVPAAKRVIATLLAITLVGWSFAHFTFANAANVTEASDLLTDSAPGVVSDHTITFGTPTGIAAGETITIEFPGGFVMDSVSAADISVTGGDANWTESISGQIVTLTKDTTAVPADTDITVQIGLNAGGTNQITNPSTTGSYELTIAGTMTDTGATRVAIVDTVEVTAAVETTFEFTVIGKDSATGVNGTTTTLTSSSTTIPFGTLTAGQIETLAQDLTVATNAANGFVVTVETDRFLESSTGAIIDPFVDGGVSSLPTAWAAPTNNVNDRTTWGHWGVTSEDLDTVGQRAGADEFVSNRFVGVSTTPIALFAHDGPADGATAGIGSTTVGYQIEITPLQEAGTDYSTTLTYIATPTF